MKAIIFDMDGVMIDSEYAYTSAIKALMSELGHSVSESYIYTFVGTTHEFTWSQIKEDYQLKDDTTTYINNMLDRREEIVAKDGIISNPNIKEFILDAYQKGYRLAIASSSPKSEIFRTVKTLDVEQYFEFIVSGEEVKHSKPAPDIFLYAAKLLELAPVDCYVIEDSKNGSLAAKAAGMYCVGYRDPQYPIQDLTAADIVVEDFFEIKLESLEEAD